MHIDYHSVLVNISVTVSIELHNANSVMSTMYHITVSLLHVSGMYIIIIIHDVCAQWAYVPQKHQHFFVELIDIF